MTYEAFTRNFEAAYNAVRNLLESIENENEQSEPQIGELVEYRDDNEGVPSTAYFVRKDEGPEGYCWLSDGEKGASDDYLIPSKWIFRKQAQWLWSWHRDMWEVFHDLEEIKARLNYLEVYNIDIEHEKPITNPNKEPKSWQILSRWTVWERVNDRIIARLVPSEYRDER